jgi:hypothetical protein
LAAHGMQLGVVDAQRPNCDHCQYDADSELKPFNRSGWQIMAGCLSLALGTGALALCQYAAILATWRPRWRLSISLLSFFVGVPLVAHGWSAILEL